MGYRMQEGIPWTAISEMRTEWTGNARTGRGCGSKTSKYLICGVSGTGYQHLEEREQGYYYIIPQVW